MGVELDKNDELGNNGDSGEKTIVQLNSLLEKLENDLRLLVKDLQEDLNNRFGLTQPTFDGAANEATKTVKNPFKLMTPVDHLDEISDKFTRNEIMTLNEIRRVIGSDEKNMASDNLL